MGSGDSRSVPHIFKFFLREIQDVDVGILKLFVSRRYVDLSHVAQPSPFGSGSRGVTYLPMPVNLHLPWDTVEIRVVQRRADK